MLTDQILYLACSVVETVSFLSLVVRSNGSGVEESFSYVNVLPITVITVRFLLDGCAGASTVLIFYVEISVNNNNTIIQQLQ